MASSDLDYPWMSLTGESFFESFNVCIKEENPAYILPGLEVPPSSVPYKCNIPSPPPLPSKSYIRAVHPRWLSQSCSVPKEIRDTWDKLFKDGYDADVFVITENKSYIRAHSSVLHIASPVLENVLRQSKRKNGIRHVKISGVPYGAVYTFIRFLYSSCYDEEDMKKFVLHLLVLSHSYSIPSLKRVCVYFLEKVWLNKENVIDVLQLARNCDATRLTFFCIQMVVRDFKSISSTEGWKVMKRANPKLEQELLESVVEADSQKQERLKKMEENKVYLQLHEAMEALLHICKDGCRTIGPCDKVLKRNQVACGFLACKGIETLVRHFSSCKTRVPGGCVRCKRMWQLLELHSRLCDEPDTCKVPLCRHFKEKVQKQQSKKDDAKWRLLVTKIIAARNFLGPFAAGRSSSVMTLN